MEQMQNQGVVCIQNPMLSGDEDPQVGGFAGPGIPEFGLAAPGIVIAADAVASGACTSARSMIVAACATFGRGMALTLLTSETGVLLICVMGCDICNLLTGNQVCAMCPMLRTMELAIQRLQVHLHILEGT